MYGLSRMYYEMPDGTIKQVNPFTGTEVWTVPGRGRKPITNKPPATATRIEHHEPEDYCNFCRSHYLNVPPEKARVVSRDGRHDTVPTLDTRDYFNTVAEFRRVPNLFEIVTMDYWRLNHGYELSKTNKEWKDRILASPEGNQHVRRVLELKMRLSGKTEQEIAALTPQQISDLSDAFFGGGHELIIAGKHYRPGAEYSSDLCSSGWLTPQEHFQYLKFTISALSDIHANNRYCRYVSVFQNWLAPAGASFDHLHKQLVALDEWGASVEEEVELARKNPNIYNELVVNFAAYSNLVFAENDYAVALADIGHRYPTIAVYSKAVNLRPWELTDAELERRIVASKKENKRAFSDRRSLLIQELEAEKERRRHERDWEDVERKREAERAAADAKLEAQFLAEQKRQRETDEAARSALAAARVAAEEEARAEAEQRAAESRRTLFRWGALGVLGLAAAAIVLAVRRRS